MAHSRSHIILDPSFLFTEEALGWINDPELAQYLVVSEALWQRMEDPRALAEELNRFGAPVDFDVIEMVREEVGAAAITRFSYERESAAGKLQGGTEEVCRALLASEEPLADALADEWAFVTSRSLAVLVERVGDALGAFVRAGATVVGVAKDQMKAALEATQEQIPPGLLKAMKRVDETWERIPKLPKFLLAGGSFAAGLAVPPLGIGMVATQLLIEGNGVLAGDP